MRKSIKKLVILASLFLAASAWAQERDSGIYISPNNDGVQDALEFSIQIRDKRYVQGWAFIIENEAGEVVRTIENKESRPEMETQSGFIGVVKSIWRMLTRVKRGVAVPDTLRWDGTMDSGAVAPDGKYFFYVTASDDNGNESSTERIAFYLDNTPPEVFAFPPYGADGMIFSPDGDNNKDTFEITQGGSVEDLWEITVFNAAGAPVREEAVRGAEPSNFVWDGKDSEGGIVPDGVYSYRIAATDRAGNKNSAEIHNIVVNTVRPSISVAIDTNAFSPNGDGVKDTIALIPDIPVTQGLQRWTVSVIGEDGSAMRVFDNPMRESSRPATIVFDGKDERGSLLPEGRYTARITAEYANGHRPEAISPVFTLDVTAPSGSITASTGVFSPVGGGSLGTVTFTHQVSQEANWLAEIIPAGGGEAVRTISFGTRLPETFEWNGRTDSGAIAPDGLYEYVLSSTDEAGNSASFRSRQVSLNTERADLILQSSTTAFSPNNDGRKDTVTFTPVIRAETPAASYSLEIRDSEGIPVRTFSGEGSVPQRFVWDGAGDSTGQICPDGTYTALLSVTLINMQSSSAESPPFVLDTQYPFIEANAEWLLFSPNEQSTRKTLPIAQRSSEEAMWRAEITNSSGAVIRSLSWQGYAEDFQWDARDNSGNRAADGVYSYTITCEDEAGNTASRTIAGITVDSRSPQVYITAELPAFSPNGDTVMDTQVFAVGANIRDNIESWNLSIVPAEGSDETVVRSWSSGTDGSLPERLEWDGKGDDGSSLEGRFRALLSVSYEKGEQTAAITPTFLINITPPALNVSLSPRFFSPDNDGIDDDLFISLSAHSLSSFEQWSFEIREPEGTAGRIFWQTGGRGTITEQIIWDGRSNEGELVQAAMDYPFTFTVKDSVGMTSVVRGYIPVDVLVIRDGDNLKIAVPSIIFARNVATFDGLDPDVIERNNQILSRIAEILNRFKSYSVVIEGHANNVTGTEREDTEELIPLSQARADAIKVILQRNGVNGARLSTVGMGGTRPVAALEDSDNWWKNRRVEFILIK